MDSKPPEDASKVVASRPYIVNSSGQGSVDCSKPKPVPPLIHPPLDNGADVCLTNLWTVDQTTGPNVAVRGRIRWFVVWRKFADYTTLHGFRQIAEDTNYTSRRVLWIILTTFAFGLLLYQMGNSVQLYLARPVAFNVHRDYKNYLTFPAITICNQNVFRITQAWGERLYGFLEKMYDDREGTGVDFPAVEKNLVEVLDTMKHRKEDLILMCTWNRVNQCSFHHLQKTIVDNSICYTFNGNISNARRTSLTGSGSGLNILMNIEQYEFMRTRSLTAGIQVFVHHQKDLPREAIAIPPGVKAFIRVSTKHVKLLSHPYGVCDSRPLAYYPLYSTAKCLTECQENWLMQKCGCHSGVLPPSSNVSMEVCSLRNYSSCIVPSLAEYTPAIGKCNCPTQCNFRRYSSFISFSQISTFDVDQALKHLPSSTPKRLIKAREVFYQANADKRYLTINKTLEPFVNITEMVHKNVVTLLTRVSNLETEVNTMEKELKHRLNFHAYMMDRIVFAVKSNWVRGWQVAQERTFQLIAFDYLPLLYSLKLFKQLTKDPNVTSKELGSYRTILGSRLYEKQQMTIRALTNMSKIHDSFVNTTLLLTYKITPYRYYDHDFAPESIITKKKKLERKFYKKFSKYCSRLVTYFTEMRGQVERARTMNDTRFDELAYLIEKRSRSFNYYLYLYEDRIVKDAAERVRRCENNFISARNLHQEAVSKLKYQLSNLKSILTNLNRLYDQSGKNVVDIAEKYVHQKNSLKYNLTFLSTFITRGPAGEMLESFVSGLDSIEVYRLTLRQALWTLGRTVIASVKSVWDDSVERPYGRYSKDLYTLCRLNASATRVLNITAEQLMAIDSRAEVNVTTINTMRKAVFEMALNSKGNTTCDHILSSTNSDWMMEGQKAVVRRLKEKMTAMLSVADFIDSVTQLKEDMMLNVGRVKSFSQDFLQGNRISRKFVRDNFVEVQIYFQDLVSVDESQSPAYTMTQLWSDFGGNFGLLLGASVLSVIEIVDFVVHESIKIKR